MKSGAMRLEDLPAAYQAQARAQLGLGTPAVKAAKTENPLVRVPRGRGPNKTEAEFNRLFLHGAGLYEAVVLKLSGGSRYTPDWFYLGSDGVPALAECKGGYRLGSEGRAATAFREAAARFPCFRFVWAVRGRDGWRGEVFCRGTVTPLGGMTLG